jgi:hypothetical protein
MPECVVPKSMPIIMVSLPSQHEIALRRNIHRIIDWWKAPNWLMGLTVAAVWGYTKNVTLVAMTYDQTYNKIARGRKQG